MSQYEMGGELTKRGWEGIVYACMCVHLQARSFGCVSALFRSAPEHALALHEGGSQQRIGSNKGQIEEFISCVVDFLLVGMCCPCFNMKWVKK